MSRVFHRQLKETLPLAISGDGMYIIDQKGNRFLDGSGGAAVSVLGHSDQDVIKSIRDQVEKLSYAHTSFFSNEPAERLANLLISHAPKGIEKVYLVSGGSEGIEAALKMCRQYFIEIGENKRTFFISRKHSYHGSTIGALSLGGNVQRRIPYEPFLFDVKYISPCYSYRYKNNHETDFEYGQRVSNELEEMIIKVGPERVIGFIAEPVVGATLGAVPSVDGYFSTIRKICDKYGILLLLDEVMCGTGRTGTLHACDHESISPDLLINAKGLGAGYQPIGSVMVCKKIYETFEKGSGFFQHGHTYIGHTLACAAAYAVQKKIIESNILNNVNVMGLFLKNILLERFSKHENIGDIRGRGLFWGVEIVKDKKTKLPFHCSISLHKKIKKEAMARKLIIYPGGGTADGVDGDHVLIAPPFITNEENIIDIVNRLEESINAAISSIII